MRTLRTIAAACLAGLALAAAGCGGDDDPSIQDIVNDLESTTTTTSEAPASLSADEVIAAGDAVCAEANAAINSLTETDRAIAAEQVRSITDGMRRDLRSLEAPDDSGAGDLQSLVNALGDQVTALEQRASTARAGDEAGYEAAGIALAAARDAALVAGEAYGFESCGQPFDADPIDDGVDSGGVAPETPTTTPAPTTPTPVPAPPGGGTGVPDGGTGGDTGGDTGDGTSGDSGGISPG